MKNYVALLLASPSGWKQPHVHGHKYKEGVLKDSFSFQPMPCNRKTTTTNKLCTTQYVLDQRLTGIELLRPILVFGDLIGYRNCYM